MNLFACAPRIPPPLGPILAAILLVIPAAAQTQQESDDKKTVPPKTQTARDEIVVTARKSEETLQEVPLSVTAFPAKALADQNITQIGEISVRTPGMHFGNFNDKKLSPLSLRGVYGGSGSAGADPAVSQYIDEVYIGQGAGAFIDFFDLERVEVLRGPQGLFFGRNSVGGAVSYTTRRPASEFEGSVESGYGTFNSYRAGALVSGPLVREKLYGKLSLISNGRDGTSRNIHLGRDVNTTGSWSARGQLLWSPRSGSELTLTGERHEVDQESLFYETLRYNPDAILVQVLDSLRLPRNGDPFDRRIHSDIEQTETLDLSGYSAHLTTLVGKASLTSVTSYREHDYTSLRDTDASALRWVYDGDPEQVDRLSQELRLSWWIPKANFLVGAYYFDQTSNNESFVDLGEDLTTALIGMPLRLRTGSIAELATKSLAGFANVTFIMNDRIDLSAGARYTRDEKAIDYAQSDPVDLLGGDVALRARDRWSAMTPAMNLRYRFSDDLRGYLNVARGFKSGGFNDALGSGDGIAFGPEFLWNYELGLKSELAGGRLTANVAAFYMDWSDIQITINNPATPIYDPIIANAGAAHSVGLEGEIVARPSSHWLLGLNFARIEAAYDGGTQPDGKPLDKIPFSPDYTGNVSAEYRGAVGAREWFAGGAVLSRGELFLTLDNQPDGRVAAHTLLDLRLGINGAGDRWRVTVWGKNVTGKKVKQRLFDLYDQPVIGQKYIALNDPATFGVTLRFDF